MSRRHYVFVAPCGCPTGLVTHGPWCEDEDQAWDEMYDRADERRARARGIRVAFVDHAAYLRDFAPLMTQTCTHATKEQP